MASDKIVHKFYEVKSIEEHSSGINQMIKLSDSQIVTVSDDCTLKFWNINTMKVEETHQTETVTCIDATGPLRHIIIAGCHSGNFLIFKNKNTGRQLTKETVENAHQNLIRVIVSLATLKDRYFLSADVCGYIRVWQSESSPKKVIDFQLDGAISYNSVVEVHEALPTAGDYSDTTLIAVALKTQKVELVVLAPARGLF